MDQTFDVPDSTDWLNTSLPSLARVDSALRCQVCKDFFDNPVITSCCHTFCSLCIRRCLSAEGKCPACRAPDQELKLRRNWAMQECVDAFGESRAGVLEFARRGGGNAVSVMADGEEKRDIDVDMDMEGPVLKKRRVDPLEMRNESTPGEEMTGRRTRSHSRRTDTNVTPDQPVPPVQTVVIDDIEDDNDGDYKPDDGLVLCPICNRKMKNEAVFSHLDRCTGPSQKSVPPDPAGFTPSRTLSSTPQPPQRLPTINYSLLKDQDLRRKLRELGIPDMGNKQLLQRRHTEWLNLWNANCDSKTPKSKPQLLRELDVWERSQGGQAFSIPNKVMRKDFDGSAWSTAHTDGYRKLIEDARRKRDEAAAKAKETAAEEVSIKTNETEQQQQQQQQQHQQNQQQHQQHQQQHQQHQQQAELFEPKGELQDQAPRTQSEQPLHPSESNPENQTCGNNQGIKTLSLDELNRKSPQGNNTAQSEQKPL